MHGLARPFGGLGKFYLFKILVCWRLVPDGNKMHGLVRPFELLGKFCLFKILVCRRPVPDGVVCKAIKCMS